MNQSGGLSVNLFFPNEEVFLIRLEMELAVAAVKEAECERGDIGDLSS